MNDTTTSPILWLGALLLILGAATFLILDTKIPALVLFLAATVVFLRAQKTARGPR